MRNRVTRWMAACGLVVAFAAAPLALAQTAAESKPLAVVAISSVDELMKDADFIGSLAGQPQSSQMIEQMLKMFTQNKGLAGLDRTKPIGILVQTSGDMPGGALCLPVTDLNALLDVAKGFQLTVADAGNGLQQITTAQGQNVFVKEAGGWALLSLSPAMLETVPADPSRLLAPLTKDYDFGATVHVQNVPESYRQQAVDAMSQGAEQGMEKKEDETDAQFGERQKMVAAQLDELKRFINELDQVTIGVSIDNAQQRAFLDFAYTAVPGTKLATDIAANSDVKTNFAGFIQPDAAVTLSFASKMTGADAAQLDQMIETLRTQAGSAIDDDDKITSDESKAKLKSAFDDFLDALKATLKAGVVDGGAVVNMTPDSLVMVAGGSVADTAKVESGLKKVAEVADEEKTEELPKVNWNAAKHKDVAFHTMNVKLDEDEEELRQLVGDTAEFVVGIGKGSVYFGWGKDVQDAVKQVIDVSAKTPNKPTAPMEMTVSLGQIINAAKGLVEEDQKPQLEMIADMLANEASGRDHVRIVGQPIENGIRMRIEAEEGVLRAIGMSAMQAQMAAAGF